MLVLVRLHLVPFRVVALHRRGTVAGGMRAARGLARSLLRGCSVLRACQAKGFQSAPQRCNRRFRGRPFLRLRGSKRAFCRTRPAATSRRRADALVIISSSRLEIPSKYAKRRVLRCFGAVFQKGHFDKSSFGSALSRAPGRKGALWTQRKSR